MLTVRILAGLAGTTHQPGEELAMTPNEARQMVAEGRAEIVEAPESTNHDDPVASERRPRVRTRGGQTETR